MRRHWRVRRTGVARSLGGYHLPEHAGVPVRPRVGRGGPGTMGTSFVPLRFARVRTKVLPSISRAQSGIFLKTELFIH